MELKVNNTGSAAINLMRITDDVPGLFTNPDPQSIRIDIDGDELEYLITVINKELLESNASFKTEIKNLDGQLLPDYKEKFPPYVEAVNRAKEAIKRVDKLNINVMESE